MYARLLLKVTRPEPESKLKFASFLWQHWTFYKLSQSCSAVWFTVWLYQTHLWGICTCPCQVQHTQHHQTDPRTGICFRYFGKRFKNRGKDQGKANQTWKIIASPCAVIIPWRAPTKTVFWGWVKRWIKSHFLILQPGGRARALRTSHS